MKHPKRNIAGSRPLKAWKRIVSAMSVAAVVLAGRYGWKLLGFRACQGVGIEAAEVSEGKVHISGFYPGPFPEGFCGYYSEERDGTLYVGFRFSAVFGMALSLVPCLLCALIVAVLG